MRPCVWPGLPGWRPASKMGCLQTACSQPVLLHRLERVRGITCSTYLDAAPGRPECIGRDGRYFQDTCGILVSLPLPGLPGLPGLKCARQKGSVMREPSAGKEAQAEPSKAQRQRQSQSAMARPKRTHSRLGRTQHTAVATIHPQRG